MSQPDSSDEDNPLGAEVEVIGDAQVVRFRNAKILSDQSVSEMGNRLSACLDAMADPPLLAVCFRGIQFLSSAGIGKLVTIQRRVKERGGELVLFDLAPATEDAFRISRLSDFFTIRPDQNAALAALSRR